MYTVTNFKSKKALKEAVADGVGNVICVSVFQPGGMYPPTIDGLVSLEGPHAPAAHTWYASAIVKDGIIQQGTVK
jgi:hypothetical protein